MYNQNNNILTKTKDKQLVKASLLKIDNVSVQKIINKNVTKLSGIAAKNMIDREDLNAEAFTIFLKFLDKMKKDREDFELDGYQLSYFNKMLSRSLRDYASCDIRVKEQKNGQIKHHYIYILFDHLEAIDDMSASSAYFKNSNDSEILNDFNLFVDSQLTTVLTTSQLTVYNAVINNDGHIRNTAKELGKHPSSISRSIKTIARKMIEAYNLTNQQYTRAYTLKMHDYRKIDSYLEDILEATKEDVIQITNKFITDNLEDDFIQKILYDDNKLGLFKYQSFEHYDEALDFIVFVHELAKEIENYPYKYISNHKKYKKREKREERNGTNHGEVRVYKNGELIRYENVLKEDKYPNTSFKQINTYGSLLPQQ